MKQSFSQFLSFIIIIGLIVFTLAIPFFYLWNWLFVKFFYFDYIDYLESAGFIGLLVMLRLLYIDTREIK